MKKFAVVMLALVLSLMLIGSAMAESKTFAMLAITDLEGNAIAQLTEEGIIVDAEGNDVSDQFPVLVVSIDDEAMTCTFGNEEEVMNGTVEVGETTEEGCVMTCTMEDGEVIELVYTVVGANSVTYVDEANGFMYVMPEIG